MAVSAKRVVIGSLATFAGIIVAAVMGFVVWAETPLGPERDALAALESDARVTVTVGARWTEFSPVGDAPSAGFAFYPGGRVDWRSYAPILRGIAERGIFVVVVPVRLNMAFFDVNAAAPAIEAHPEITRWAVGGHSLGGVAASLFAEKRADLVRGLVFWASYPSDATLVTEGSPLFGKIRVLSVSASNDGLATPEKIADSKALLPGDTRWVVVVGGNHGGFGDYGPQKGDNPAEIAVDEQWRQTAEATAEFLSTL